MNAVYAKVLADAEKSGLAEDEVKKLVDDWIGGAKLYGDSYANDVRIDVVRSLSTQKPYTKLTFALAKEAEKTIPETAPAEARQQVASLLAKVADAAGDAVVARTARAKADILDVQLDQEYLKTVPPFKPDADSGLKDRKSKKVVLMELFTGAECPPCVPVDVAFDALMTTYKPTEVLFLQYHLHIPGPDPMTNPITEDRQGYYPASRVTPSVFFDGSPDPTGGGRGIAASKSKYETYRKTLDQALENPAKATVGLKVEQRWRRDQDCRDGRSHP